MGKIRLVLMCLVGLWAVPTQAATLQVTDLGDDASAGTLRFLIQVAADSDTILIPAGTISLTVTDAAGDGTRDLDITKSLTLQGSGSGTTVIDGSHADHVSGTDRVFDVNPTGLDLTVTLAGMTIQGGNISGNGGGIRISGNANVTIKDDVIRLNSAVAGGGIHHSGTGSVTLQNTSLFENSVNNCAGIFIDSGGNADSDGTCFSGEGGVGSETMPGGGVAGLGTAPPPFRKFPDNLIQLEPKSTGRLTAVCGNGVMEAGEECDDGGRCLLGTPCTKKADCGGEGACLPVSGDGCSVSCHYEPVKIDPNVLKPWYRKMIFWK